MSLRSRINRLERDFKFGKGRLLLSKPELIVTCIDFCSGEKRIIFPPERVGQLVEQSHNELAEQT
jgi:hypothetical protein